MKHLLIFACCFGLGSSVSQAQTTLTPLPTETPTLTPSILPAKEEHVKRVAEFQAELNAEYKDVSRSPLPAAERRKFAGLPFFPITYAFCVEARFERDSAQVPFAMTTTNGQQPLYRKYGQLHFTLDDRPQHLTVYQSLDLQNKPGYEDYLFVPFTDQTNGHTSYGGGRYLDLRFGQIKEGQVVLDFNHAYNPYCAYNSQYSCPVPPAENRLPVSIPAGVMNAIR